MSAESFHARLRAVFHEAIDLPADVRAAFLDRACEGDARLRADVDGLIGALGAAGGFLEEPAMAAVERWEPTGLDAESAEIGPYRIIRPIGEGGMGTVYLAVRADDAFRKKVAIKVIKRGMDSASILRRFRHERQTLADLDHPSIARVLDGGTAPDGRPFFVLEYVEGVPLIDYCRDRALTVEQRLALFRTVCDAVHYAHRQLVVHRDLKPDNILVTTDGRPKLLDFGIAKLLHAQASDTRVDLTDASGRPMTPAYASPEQMRGQAIGTSSDVYALGVLLYEVLTDRRPYRLDGLTPEQMQHVVCEVDPLRPSEAHGHPQPDRRLRGDLDAIVLTAMRKAPERRYSSVSQLSDDIQRHLEGRPVVAREDTAGYRARKFVGRHRAAVVVAGLVTAAVATGVAATVYQARAANRERQRAERRFNDVRQLANALIFELHDGIERLPGATPVREQLVRRALAYLDSLAQEAEGAVDLQRELAAAYQRVGDVQGNPYRPNLGQPPAALRSYERARTILERLVARDPADVEAQRGLAAAHERMGDVRAIVGDVAGAVTSQRLGLAIRTTLRDRHQEGPAEVGTSHYKLAEALGWSGDLAGALTSARQSLDLRVALSSEAPRDVDRLLAAATSGVKLGELTVAQGDRAGGLALYKEAQARVRTAAALDPNNARARRQLAIAHGKIAEEMTAAGDAAAAAAEHRTALTIREQLLADDPANAQAKREVAISSIMASQVPSPGTAPAAHLARAIELFEELASTTPTGAARSDLVIAYRMAGEVLTPSDPAQAVRRLTQARALAGELAGQDASDVEILRETLNILIALGKAHAAEATRSREPGDRRARRARSRDAYERALALSTELQRRGAITAADANDEAVRAELRMHYP